MKYHEDSIKLKFGWFVFCIAIQFLGIDNKHIETGYPKSYCALV